MALFFLAFDCFFHYGFKYEVGVRFKFRVAYFMSL